MWWKLNFLCLEDYFSVLQTHIHMCKDDSFVEEVRSFHLQFIVDIF